MPVQGSGGFFLSLLTESFAVRALLGSLAATGCAALAVRLGWVQSSRARRILVLAPVVTVAVAAVAVAREGGTYLPQLWVASGGSGPASQILQLLGEFRIVSTSGGFDVLVLAYCAVVGVLTTRRIVGMIACRRLLWRAESPAAGAPEAALTYRLSRRMGIDPPRVRLLEGCPGGAFTTGTRHPVIVLDPALVAALDHRELEGLLAHELAHVRRRDTLLWLGAGILRDLTFFLPPLHFAVRWLRREQEESADELASRHTRRPGALASSILKVWNRHGGASVPQSACAALGPRFAFAGAASAPTPAARVLAARIKRLIFRPVLSRLRRRVEASLAIVVLVVALGAALVVPRWVVTGLNAYSLSFAYLAASGAVVEESPAFATFRALAPPAAPTRAQPGAAAATDGSSACPCVESQAQLLQGVPARGSATPRMLWHGSGQVAWELRDLRARALESRPLLTVGDSRGQVGFFVVSRTAAHVAP